MPGIPALVIVPHTGDYDLMHTTSSARPANVRDERYNRRMTKNNPTPSDPLRLNPEPLPKPKPEPTAPDSDKTEPKKKRVKRKKH
jgi:hypothetical protein